MTTRMVRLSHRDIDACSQVMRELYAETSLPSLRGRLLPLLSRVITTEYSSLNDFNSHQQCYAIHVHPARPELETLKPQFAATVGTHPFSDYVRLGTPEPRKISDRVTLREFRKTGVYQEYYRHAGVRHQMFCFFRKEGKTAIGLGLNRWHRDFSERDRAVLGFLAPHIGQAYQNAHATTGTALDLAAVGEGLDSIHRAVVLARADGVIRWMSHLAREWLQEFFPDFSTHPAKLPPLLKNWIYRASKMGRAGRPNFSELQLATVAACRLLAYCGATRDGEFVIALIRERAGIPPGPARSFDLTPREAEILYWISESKTNPEIAVILGISLRTIHKHAEHLFAKLGVTNRLEAQRLGLELRRM